MLALRDALDQTADDGTRCVVLTGAGGHFSSGADIRQAVRGGLDPEVMYRLLTQVYAPALLAVRRCPWPVIAAVDGMAAGLGCDLALACDMRLASTRAVFAELFVRVGLIPDGGGTWLLPRLVGTGRAMEMMLTGRDVNAEEAARIGLANHVFEAETFTDEVMAFAETVSRQSPHALRRGKAAMLAALETGYAGALAAEAEQQREILSSEDGPEGFRAFVEKRPPVWTGR
jgi:2-(1,2-epoxy-1,2-dihydrophenyl)acetyl-CoA isomerase